MILKRVIAIFALTMAYAGNAQAAPINNYFITSSDSVVNSLKAFPWTGGFTLGIAETTTGGSPVDVSFVFSGSTLTLTETNYSTASPLNASFTWAFSELNLGYTITGVTAGSATDAGATIDSFDTSNITITTPTGMTFAGSPHQWVFNIAGGAAAVPEPSSIAFLMLGGAGIWLKRRRQVA